MKILKSISSTQTFIRQLKHQRKSIGFVPTMGALHEGHLALVRRGKKENKTVIVSIFVNPIQFGPTEDFKKYPRVFKNDKMLLQKENVTSIIFPSVEEMYPKSFLTSVKVSKLDQHLCGRFRPGHFEGVATIVCKLLNLVQPDHLYLGQKDAQQAVILKNMVADLNFPIQVKICPTIRENDGLAMSSRNRYLDQVQRSEAPVLYQALREVLTEIRRGEKNSTVIIGKIQRRINQSTSGRIQYIECVDAETLTPLKSLHGKVMIALAVYFGNTRLIDNVMMNVP